MGIYILYVCALRDEIWLPIREPMRHRLCQFEYSIPCNWVFIKNNPYGSLIIKISLIKRIWPPRSNIAERQAVVQNVPPPLTNKLSYPYETQEIQMTINSAIWEGKKSCCTPTKNWNSGRETLETRSPSDKQTIPQLPSKELSCYQKSHEHIRYKTNAPILNLRAFSFPELFFFS